MSRWKDTLGIAASIGCAIHCAATPILLAFLPALKLTEWMASPQFHQVAALVCCSLVAISIWPAFRKYRDYKVLALSSVGLALVISAAFFLPDHCCDHTDETAHVEGMKFVSFSSASKADTKVCKDACCQNNVFAARRAAMLGTIPPSPSPSTLTDASSTELSSTDLSTTDQVFASTASVQDSFLEAEEHVHVSSFWGIVQPWMTPLGGLLLVLAHGLNLRRSLASRSCGSACKCNKSETSMTALSGQADSTLAA